MSGYGWYKMGQQGGGGDDGSDDGGGSYNTGIATEGDAPRADTDVVATSPGLVADACDAGGVGVRSDVVVV